MNHPLISPSLRTLLYLQIPKSRSHEKKALTHSPYPLFVPPRQPQRAALYIKANYSRSRFERIWARYWRYMFFDHIDISKPEGLARLLADDGAGDAPEVRAVFVNDLDSAHANQSPLGDNGGGACSPQEVRAILEAAASPQYKNALTEATAGVLEMGAYGAPWFWVVPDRKTEGDQAESQAEGEPFFGSDRFGHMWRFLGVPFRDTEIVPKL